MFCENCGANLANNASFCGSCGTRAYLPATDTIRKLNFKFVLFLFICFGTVLFAINKFQNSSSNEHVSTAEVVFSQEWFEAFKNKTWQEMQGLSCGSNRFQISGDELITTQGTTVVKKKYQIKNIDNSQKSFVLVMNSYFRDGPLAEMFPDNIDNISGSQVYTFQVLSDHKVKLVRKIQSIDLEAMIAGGPLSYKPEEIDTHIIFDCEQ